MKILTIFIVSFGIGTLVGYNSKIEVYDRFLFKIKMGCVSKKIKEDYCTPVFVED